MQDMQHNSEVSSSFPFPSSSDKNAQLGENQYETVDPVEAAKLLGTQDSHKSRPAAKKEDEHEVPSANCEYAVVNKKDKKVSCELDIHRETTRS